MDIKPEDVYLDGGAKFYHETKKHKDVVQDTSLKIKIKLGDRAIVPTKGTTGAAAFDIYCPQEVELLPGKTIIIPLDFKVEIPEGYELKLLPRSGLSTKGVIVRNSPGTIDSDYRGEMGVILKYEPEDLCHRVDKLYKLLINFCKNFVTTNNFHLEDAKKHLLDGLNCPLMKPYVIEKGDRIGQLQLQKVIDFQFTEVNEINETARGEGGFGSTGT